MLLENISDNSKFNSNSLKKYMNWKGINICFADEKENFLVAIVNENPKIDINSKYKDYVKTKELTWLNL